MEQESSNKLLATIRLYFEIFILLFTMQQLQLVDGQIDKIVGNDIKGVLPFFTLPKHGN